MNEQPWKDLGVTGRDVNPVRSMIAPDESLYLYWLARHCYTGQGEIVDGGPYLGGSTVAMASGMLDNPKVAQKESRIHSYDLFLYSPLFKRMFPKNPPADGASVLPMFLANIARFKANVEIYPGDILARRWNGKPIEILFIDVAKTWDIQLHLLREFFPSLRAGLSYVVQQDYFFVRCYWIHLVMEYLAHYFQPVHMPDGPTLGFSCIRDVPTSMLALDYRTRFSKEQASELMDAAHGRFSGAKRLVARTAKVSMLLEYGAINEAGELLDAIVSDPAFGPAVQIDFDKAKETFDKVSAAAARRTVAVAS
jgi:hypothetical protein